VERDARVRAAARRRGRGHGAFSLRELARRPELPAAAEQPRQRRPAQLHAAALRAHTHAHVLDAGRRAVRRRRVPVVFRGLLHRLPVVLARDAGGWQLQRRPVPELLRRAVLRRAGADGAHAAGRVQDVEPRQRVPPATGPGTTRGERPATRPPVTRAASLAATRMREEVVGRRPPGRSRATGAATCRRTKDCGRSGRHLLHMRSAG
jgi:hypothetical protein